jgi:hypothetical protein
MRREEWKKVVAGTAVAAFLTMSGGASASAGEDNPWRTAGLGLGSVLSNVVYMPAKIVYGALGSVTGGLTYLLTGGSHETAQNVWVASLGGTWVIVPDNLTGQTPVEFSGTPRATQVAIVEESAPMNTQPPADSLGYAVDNGY